MLAERVKNVTNRRLICESQNVIKVPDGVLWVAARVGAADCGKGASRSEQVAQRVCQLRSLCEGAYEDQINIVRHGLDQIFETGIAHKSDVMSFLFAPRGYDLGHNAGEIGIHQARKQ